MNYRLVQQLQEKAVSVQQSCQALAVSRSGYYACRPATQTASAIGMSDHRTPKKPV